MANQEWRGRNNPEPIRLRVFFNMLRCPSFSSLAETCFRGKSLRIQDSPRWILIRCIWIHVPYSYDAACAPRLELILVRQIDIYSYINQSLLQYINYKNMSYMLTYWACAYAITNDIHIVGYHKISQHSILVHVPDCTTHTTCKNCNLDLQQKQTWKVCSKGRRVWKFIIRYFIYGSSGLSSFVTI